MCIGLFVVMLEFFFKAIWAIFRPFVKFVVKIFSKLFGFVKGVLFGSDEDEGFIEGERILYEYAASYVSGSLLDRETQDGTLIITEKRVMFKADALFFEQTLQVNLFFSDIDSVFKKRIKLVFNDGVLITTRDGASFLFRTKDRDHFVHVLNKTMHAPQILEQIKRKVYRWKREGYRVEDLEVLIARID